MVRLGMSGFPPQVWMDEQKTRQRDKRCAKTREPRDRCEQAPRRVASACTKQRHERLTLRPRPTKLRTMSPLRVRDYCNSAGRGVAVRLGLFVSIAACRNKEA